ncbi:hypothetical protein NDU88_001982 [Pleurodeles waltl]|uniref:Uncharacterized protein n=1 Tax=Pleurodeles waltl TaxID=8319 RepID=A0AAV7MMI0_PLEWA|nr:hypothetical protein NDU88_001982 [Pleurodeles waltl]
MMNKRDRPGVVNNISYSRKQQNERKKNATRSASIQVRQFPPPVSQVEQQVSDLEDVENQAESTTSRIQSELEDL